MMPLLVVSLLAKTPPIELAFEAEIEAAVSATRGVYPVPATLVRAVIKQESGFRPKALSACGARGLMQVMPYNTKKLGLAREEDLWIPRLNVLAGVRLLAVLLRHYQGDVISALVAYNAGPRAPKAVPNNSETPEYVAAILRFWREYEVREFARSGGCVPRPPSLTSEHELPGMSRA